MLDDRQRRVLQHPLRQVLLRAARTGEVLDAAELLELRVDDEVRRELASCAENVARAARRGGLRSKHRAAVAAEQMADVLARHALADDLVEVDDSDALANGSASGSAAA